MRNGKEGNESGRNFPHSWVSAESLVRNQVSRFVEAEPKRSTGKELQHIGSLGEPWRRCTAEHEHACERSSRGTHVAAFRGEAQQLL